MPFINKDADISIEQLPPTFTTGFRDKAAKWYINLAYSGWSPEAARTEAAKHAIEELEADYIFAVSQDQLYVLPRYDNPADLRWTEQAGDEFYQLFNEAQRTGEIPNDSNADDWRPITVKGDNYFQFVRGDDPLNVLTDTNGEPVRFRPKTFIELAREQQGQVNRDAERQAEHDVSRAFTRKMKMVEWVINQRSRRDQGLSFDYRLSQIDDKIKPEHVEWYRRNHRQRIGLTGSVPVFHKRNKDIEPQEPPMLGIDPLNYQTPESLLNTVGAM